MDIKEKWELSLYKSPITNVKPLKNIEIIHLIELIKSNKYKDTVLQIRKEDNKEKKNELKKNKLDYVTIGGTFTSRGDKNIISPSGLAPIDIDGIEKGLEELKIKLKEDPYILALFISPSGKGLKAIVRVPTDVKEYSNYVESYYDYLHKKYGIDAGKLDKATKDISRACFLSWDEDIWVNNSSKVFEEKKEKEKEEVPVIVSGVKEKIPPWVGDFLLVYCLNNKLPPGGRNAVVEKSLVILMKESVNWIDIKRQYKQVQGKGSFEGWEKKFDEGDITQVSPGEIVNYIHEKEINFNIPKVKIEGAEEGYERVELPKSGRLISEFLRDIKYKLAAKHNLFFRGDTKEIVEVGIIEHEGEGKEFTGFRSITASRFITKAEEYFEPGNVIYSKEEGQKWKPKSMGKELANTCLCSPQLEESLPYIKRIFTIPLPIIYKGELTFPIEGYDKRFYSWLPYNSPKIDPSFSLEKSKELIEEIFEDFCFKEENDRNMAISGLITPFLRGLYESFSCRTPLFVYLANRERVGKDYLANISGIIYEGEKLEEPPISTTGDKWSGTNEELRKKIMAAFIGGRKRMHFSNNKGYIDNAVFEGVLTNEKYSDRLLGGNKLAKFNNEIEFSLSGNEGLGFTPDLMNRSRFIRQFYSLEDTNKRKFKRPNLHYWILKNRGTILSAIYGLINYWVKNGCKAGSQPFASYPEWARVCGGVMECVGYNSPCTQDTMSVNVGGDPEMENMTALYKICFEKFPNQPIDKNRIRDIIIDEGDIFPYLDFMKKADQTKFGSQMVKFKGRVLSGISMNVEDENIRTQRWKYIFSRWSPMDTLVTSVSLSAKTDFLLGKRARKVTIGDQGDHPENPVVYEPDFNIYLSCSFINKDGRLCGDSPCAIALDKNHYCKKHFPYNQKNEEIV